MKSSLIIDSVDQNGVKKQKTITNINPEASNADAKEFARRFTALSTNEFTGASRVNKMDIDEPYQWGGGSTITIAGDTVTVTVAGETITVPGEPVTVTVEAAPTTVTVEAEPVTVTVEAEPVTITVEAEPVTMTVQADPKTNPTFSLGEWAGSNNTYSAVVSYNGDGVLTANTGTLSGSTITVEDADGNFSGVISAAEGTNFAPANLAFTHTKETVGGGSSSKITPELSITLLDREDEGLEPYETAFAVEYNGDGQLFAGYAIDTQGDDYYYALVFPPVPEEDMDYYFVKVSYYGDTSYWQAYQLLQTLTIYATEGEQYAAAGLRINSTNGIYDSLDENDIEYF